MNKCESGCPLAGVQLYRVIDREKDTRAHESPGQDMQCSYITDHRRTESITESTRRTNQHERRTNIWYCQIVSCIVQTTPLPTFLSSWTCQGRLHTQATQDPRVVRLSSQPQNITSQPKCLFSFANCHTWSVHGVVGVVVRMPRGGTTNGRTDG